MLKFFKYIFLYLFIIFCLALISPLKAVYTTNAIKFYTIAAYNTITNEVIQVAMKIKKVFRKDRL